MNGRHARQLRSETNYDPNNEEHRIYTNEQSGPKMHGVLQAFKGYTRELRDCERRRYQLAKRKFKYGRV